MPMNVILLERVPKLGQMGDVVRVKPGFARNYLLPQKKALRATKEALRLDPRSSLYRENLRFLLDLPVAQGAEPAGPVDPFLVAAINATPGARAVFRVLHMHHPDAVAIDIEKAQIIHLLQQQVAGIVQDAGPRMMAD